MRRLHRPALDRKTWVWLSLRTRQVLAADDPKKTAVELWRAVARHRYRSRVREALLSMSSGVERCMYCEDSAAHAIEHFWPKARYPERVFCWENLLVVCARCNGFKLARFPLDRGEPLLIDPTVEDPALHLETSPRVGRLVARDGSPKGQTTIDVLRLNRSELERGRRSAWQGLERLLVCYAEDRSSGRHDRAERCEREIRERPFSALLHFMRRILELPEPERYLEDPGCVGTLRSLVPEIRAWIDAAPTLGDPERHAEGESA
jgi:uncharacterized protein (TIGR02646 family)